MALAVALSFLAGAPKAALAAGEAKYVYDAAVLPDGDIAILYIAGGYVNLGKLHPITKRWVRQQIVTGKDAALAIDVAGNPHIAYITADDDLGYTYFDGDSWAVPEIVDSLNVGGAGVLTYPDIAVDSVGRPHITYFDSRGGYEGGNSYDSYDKDDLMYATNVGGALSIGVRSYSDGDTDYSSYYNRRLVAAPSRISLVDGTYFIGAKHYAWDRSVMGNLQNHNYTFNLLLPTTSVPSSYSCSISTSSSDGSFVLYETDSDGTNIYSLFKKSNSLHVTSGVTEVPAATKAFAGTAADLVADVSGAVYYAGIATENLLLYQDGNFKEGLALPNAISTTHARMATVMSGGVQFVLYTDTAGAMWVCGVSADPGDSAVSSFEIPDKLPVTITGVAVAEKTYDGSAVSYTGAPSAAVTGTGGPAAVGEYTYTWYDTTLGEPPVLLSEAPKDVGSYRLIVAVSDSDGTYTGSVAIPFEITPKTITISGVAATGRTYDGTTTVDITGGTLVGVADGDSVTPSVPATGSVANANAGDAKSVTIAATTLSGADAGNYSLTQPAGITVSIGKAPLTIASVDANSKVYDGTTAAAVSGAAFGGLQGAESLTLGVDYTVTGSYSDAGAGAGKTVTGNVSLLSTATANNYSLADGSFAASASIAKSSGLTATNPSVVPMLKDRAAEYTFDLTTIGLNESDTGTVTYTLGTLTGGTLFSAVPAVDADGTTLRFSSAGLAVGTATQAVAISTQNYADTTATLTFVLVDKTPVTITGVAVAGKTYDGSSVSYSGAPSATVTDTSDEATIGEYTYTWYDVTAGGTLPQAPRNAGSYKLVVAVSDSDDTYTGSLDVPFTVSSKVLTVKPKDYSIYTGANLPTPEVEYVGLLSSENGSDVVNLSEALQMEIRNNAGAALANSGTSGTYSIVFTNSPIITSANYSVTTANGTLTVRSKPSSGGSTIAPAPMAIETSGNTTTARPGASVTSGEARTTISTADAQVIIRAARNERAAEVVIAPVISAAVQHACVEISAASVSDLAGAGVRLTIDTPIAAVELSHDALSAIAQAPGAIVSVEAQRSQDGSVRVSIRIDDTELDDVGSIRVRVPSETTSPSAVAVLVKDDGTQEIIRRSALTDGGLTVLLEGSGTIRVVDNDRQFSDLGPSHWASGAIAFASSRELFTGTGEGNFSPDMPMSRGMFVTVLHRLESEIRSDSSPSFEDVPPDAWYTQGVAWAHENGIVQGFGAGTFAPEQSITREQLAVMMFNYARAVGLDTSATGDVSAFADGGEVADWAQDAMRYVIGAGLISGKGEGLLDPKAGATRAEVAAILQRLIARVVDQGF